MTCDRYPSVTQRAASVRSTATRWTHRPEVTILGRAQNDNTERRPPTTPGPPVPPSRGLTPFRADGSPSRRGSPQALQRRQSRARRSGGSDDTLRRGRRRAHDWLSVRAAGAHSERRHRTSALPPARPHRSRASRCGSRCRGSVMVCWRPVGGWTAASASISMGDRWGRVDSSRPVLRQDRRIRRRRCRGPSGRCRETPPRRRSSRRRPCPGCSGPSRSRLPRRC